MSEKIRGSWVPVAAFAVAVLLSALANTRVIALQGRPPGGVTCQVSATLVGIGGNAAAWTLNLTNVKIDTTNNKKAVLEGNANSGVQIDMSGTDTTGTPFNFPGMLTSFRFTPEIKAGYDPGTRVGQFAPMTCTRATIEASGKETATVLLANAKRKPRKWNVPTLPAQNVVVQVNGTFKCLREEPGVGIANALTVTLVVNAAGNAPPAAAGIP